MRMIDAGYVMKAINRHLKHLPVGQYEAGFNDGLNTAMLEIMAALTQSKESLTLDELRQMDGQPVYIISKAHTISEWNIPKGVGEIVIAYDVPCAGMKSVIPSVEFIDGKNLSVEKYGSDWIAYRRPPEGDEENE